MHKYSYRHFKENVQICEMQETYVSLNQDVGTYSDWIVKTSTVINIQTEHYPKSFVADGRSMQNDINIKKRNKQGRKIQLQMNQISSYQQHFFLLCKTTAQHRILFSFYSGFETWCLTGKGRLPLAQHTTWRTRSQYACPRRQGDPVTPSDTG
jgi:hypothetical protein